MRETFATGIAGCPKGIAYRADHIDQFGDGNVHPIKWKPSIHMPRWASRITLDVTSIRIERLQDTTEADAVAEGTVYYLGSGGKQAEEMSMLAQFAMMWDSIYGQTYPWNSNPYVWVLGFRRQM